MHLLNILKQKGNSLLIFLLGLISLLVVLLPYARNSFDGSFYIVDPDAVYVGNAISYTKAGQISYVDHPGTPAIQALASAIIPIRLYSKFVIKQPFITFAVSHYRFMFTYFRLFQAAIFTIGVLVLLYGISTYSKSNIAVLFGWSYLFSFSALPYFGLSISAESLNFLILSIWSTLVLFYTKSRSPITLGFICIVAGFALSNRLTNLFVVMASMGLSFFLLTTIKYKLRNIFINGIFVVLGFLLGTIPITSRYGTLFGWITRLATTSKVHGGGSTLNIKDYLNSLEIVVSMNPAIMAISLGGLVLMILYFMYRRKISIVMYLMFMATIGIVVFSKYPLAHYQTANFLLVLLSIIIFVGNSLRTITYTLLALVLLIMFVPKNLNSYYHSLDLAMKESIVIDHEAASVETDGIATIWEWSVSRDFSLLWGNSWTGQSYQPELGIIRSNLYQLGGDLKSYRNHDGRELPLFSMCWKSLFIQTSEVPRFLRENSTQRFTIKKLQNTRMSVITSSHCSTKP